MLSFVATPIGNLDDVSLRQARTLFSSDIILAEDTRSAQILMQYVQKHLASYLEKVLDGRTLTIPKTISYYKDKEMSLLPEIIEWLERGMHVSLISEAGMPVISDPGFLLLKTVLKHELPYEVVPGASAVTTALLHAHFKTDQFMFVGFFPKKDGQLRALLQKFIETKVFFQ